MLNRKVFLSLPDKPPKDPPRKPPLPEACGARSGACRTPCVLIISLRGPDSESEDKCLENSSKKTKMGGGVVDCANYITYPRLS